MNGPALWNILCKYGIKDGLLNVISAVDSGNKPCLRVSGIVSEWFSSEQEVRQEYMMSP